MPVNFAGRSTVTLGCTLTRKGSLFIFSGVLANVANICIMNIIGILIEVVTINLAPTFESAMNAIIHIASVYTR